MSKPVAVKNSRPNGTGLQRALSASEIARNARNFETWSTYQNCEEASFADVPAELVSDIKEIFCMQKRIPKAWLNGKPGARNGGEGLGSFLKSAFDASPSVFSNNTKKQDEELAEEIAAVFLAWKRLLRAHVDWCEVVDGKPVVVSAPYSRPGMHRESMSDRPFHEWDLDNPSDILEVYFLVRNIDDWTCGRFHQRVVQGLNHLVENLTLKEGTYQPWKWIGNTLAVKVLKENVVSSTATSSGFSPPPKKDKRRRRRRSSRD